VARKGRLHHPAPVKPFANLGDLESVRASRPRCLGGRNGQRHELRSHAGLAVTRAPREPRRTPRASSSASASIHLGILLLASWAHHPRWRPDARPRRWYRFGSGNEPHAAAGGKGGPAQPGWVISAALKGLARDARHGGWTSTPFNAEKALTKTAKALPRLFAREYQRRMEARAGPARGSPWTPGW